LTNNLMIAGVVILLTIIFMLAVVIVSRSRRSHYYGKDDSDTDPHVTTNINKKTPRSDIQKGNAKKKGDEEQDITGKNGL
jgi:hypothetical protein